MTEAASTESDYLTGARQIARYLNWPERRVYHCAYEKLLPIGKLGALLVARKSQLDRALTPAVEQ